MILVLLYWLLIFLVIYLTGFSFISFMEKYFIAEQKLIIDEYFFTGFIIISIFSAYASIIAPVAWAMLLIASLVIVSFSLFFKSKLIHHLKEGFDAIIRLSSVEKIVGLFLLFFLALIASGKVWVFDTNLYHAQNIQWIRNYAVVPGLGNLQPQFGFNNMFFTVSALFTLDIGTIFKDRTILIYPLNGIAVSLLLLKLLFFIKEERQQGAFRKGSFYFLVFAFCLLLFPKWVNSPAADIICGVITIYTFLIVEKYQEKLSFFQCAFLSSLIILCITFKLSSLFLGLLLIPLILINFSQRKLLSITTLGVFLVIPFFLRNYYLSGYLVFPFPSIDFFDVDWKISYAAASFEKLVIWSWARIPSMSPIKVQAMSFEEWFGVWWSQKDLIWKPILLVNSLSVVSIIIFLQKRVFYPAFLQGIILLNLLFWFYNAPDPRFAFGFLSLGAAFTLSGFLLIKEVWKFFSFNILLFSIGLSITISIYFYRMDIKNFSVSTTNWLLPEPLPVAEVETVTTNFTYYKPIKGNMCYNYPLPCATRPLGYIVLRDSLIQNGFKTIQPSN